MRRKVVNGTGYALRTEAEEDALFVEKRRMDAAFEEESLPLYEAVGRDRRETADFWGTLENARRPWWQKLGEWFS